MSVASPELHELSTARREPQAAPPPIIVTERAAEAVNTIVNQQRVQRLEELAPDLAGPFKTFLTEKGRAPTLAELAASVGITEKDLLIKLGSASYAKNEPLPAEFRDQMRELSAAHAGQVVPAAELAARVNLSEADFLNKVGYSAATILGKVYLRLRTLGGGCSGLQDKLDIDPEFNAKRDALFDFHGVPVVVDQRSLLYVMGVTVDYHNELNRSGFSISNPNRKTTCGCGSSYSM